MDRTFTRKFFIESLLEEKADDDSDESDCDGVENHSDRGSANNISDRNELGSTEKLTEEERGTENEKQEEGKEGNNEEEVIMKEDGESTVDSIHVTAQRVSLSPSSSFSLSSTSNTTSIAITTPRLLIPVQPYLSTPLKIAEAIRKMLLNAKGMSVQVAEDNVWSHNGGLYTFAALIFLYFINCAHDWDAADGQKAVKLCSQLHFVLEKKQHYSDKYTDVRS